MCIRDSLVGAAILAVHEYISRSATFRTDTLVPEPQNVVRGAGGRGGGRRGPLAGGAAISAQRAPGPGAVMQAASMYRCQQGWPADDSRSAIPSSRDRERRGVAEPVGYASGAHDRQLSGANAEKRAARPFTAGANLRHSEDMATDIGSAAGGRNGNGGAPPVLVGGNGVRRGQEESQKKKPDVAASFLAAIRCASTHLVHAVRFAADTKAYGVHHMSAFAQDGGLQMLTSYAAWCGACSLGQQCCVPAPSACRTCAQAARCLGRGPVLFLVPD